MHCLRFLFPAALMVAFFLAPTPSPADSRPNILIITVDDMSADSVGVFGCRLRDTTPNIDQLARSGMRFEYAHVQVGNCMPSRNVMWSGRYPHNNKVEGFYQVRDIDYPVLADLMKNAGYFTAIRHKVSHSTPYSPYDWDLVLDTLPDGRRLHVKDAESYGQSTTRAIRAAADAGKPFCVMINISDPHKPFYAQGKKGETIPDPHKPTRVFYPEECPVPGFLFDDPVVRKELSHYYSSVRRADDGVGSVLRALRGSGHDQDTLVIFLSDHGMALPFAKTQLYHHSTHTPLIIRWPGVTKPDSIDRQHMVSAVDLLPTILDAAGIDHPDGLDGRSFEPLLRGQSQDHREMVFKEYNENAGGSRDPMRAVQTKRYLYIFNPWSNGKRVMATATTGTPTYRRMAELAKSDPNIRARHELYRYRVPEELYDVETDPDCLHNLIDSPTHQEVAEKLRSELENWMVNTGDPMLETFRNRNDPAAREAYVQAQEREADARRKAKRKNQPARRNLKLIRLQLPKTVVAGKPMTVRIAHSFPNTLGTQTITVTLKGGNRDRRITRKTVTASGRGEVAVTFEVPEQVADKVVRVAAFVGKEYAASLQHIQSARIDVTPQFP